MTPLWFVYHVPKTGGQTIRDYLAREMRRGVDFEHLGKWDRSTPLGFDEVAARDEASRAGLRVLCGHPLSRQFAGLFPGRPIREVVFLREPVSRLISHYNFAMTMRSRRGHETIALEQYLDEQQPDPMTHFLGQRLGETKPRKHLNIVLHELGQFWLAGRTESLDLLLPHLFEGMGLPAQVPHRSNVTGVTIELRATPTPDLADEIRRQNPLDVMLYAAIARFETRFLERVSGVGSYATEQG